MTLTDFILARIAEDEAVARRVLPYVEAQGAQIEIYLSRTETMPDGSRRGTSETVSPYDPARVLAQCAALRAVVERYVTAAAEADAAWKDYSEWVASSDKAWRGEHPPPRTVPAEELNGLAWAVTALAAIWSDHEDYRPEEWA